MATKKTNSKGTKKSATKKEEQPVKETKEIKNAENMSVEELTGMFINNDTKAIEQLKENNNPEAPVFENVEEEKVLQKDELEKLVNEVVSEHAKKTPTKTVEEPKQPCAIAKKTEPQKKVQQPNTNRSVYGYDHFGIIYGY